MADWGNPLRYDRRTRNTTPKQGGKVSFFFFFLLFGGKGCTYTYDLRTTFAVRGVGGCLTTKKGAWCGAILVRCGAFFVDFFHFLLLFVTFFIARKFYKLLLSAEKGKICYFCYFCYFFYCL